jgi:hypothetical protein
MDACARQTDEDAEFGRCPLWRWCVAVTADAVLCFLLDGEKLFQPRSRLAHLSCSLTGNFRRSYEKRADLGSSFGINLPHGLSSHVGKSVEGRFFAESRCNLSSVVLFFVQGSEVWSHVSSMCVVSGAADRGLKALGTLRGEEGSSPNLGHCRRKFG